MAEVCALFRRPERTLLLAAERDGMEEKEEEGGVGGRAKLAV